MALSRMHVKAQSRCYTELRAEATPVAIWRGIVDFPRLQPVRDCEVVFGYTHLSGI
jgi:hypothetical protein